MTAPVTDSRQALRTGMRRRRRQLGGADRDSAESALLSRITALPVCRAAHRIGTFAAFDGEPDLSRLGMRCPAKRFFVPVIGEKSMRFAAVTRGMRTRRNRFGIVEPRSPRYFDARHLDLVLTPLVAFDSRGVRIGVGRGYYDRAFRFLRRRSAWQHPKLLGVAFSFQAVTRIEANPWDVPLWGVVTEDGWQQFAQRH
jgi:5-formyltetrahydrofolate cyclo-ligase